MNKKFPILSIISIIFRIFGWITVFVGLYYFIYQGVIEPNLEGHSFSPQDTIEIFSGIGSIFGGLLSVAFGEAIHVLFAIEENTRKAANA
ncbi:MAG: hypothetical protein KKD44_02015 [Proteobacteria bacterium]|nr:hypothetical protein [Pseudomonadota bacterium]